VRVVKSSNLSEQELSSSYKEICMIDEEINSVALKVLCHTSSRELFLGVDLMNR
jgi:hypothetical protein